MTGLTCLASLLVASAPVLWETSQPQPATADLAPVEDARFAVIKPYEFARDGYRFLHGVALAWHGEKLYASFGHNKGGENTDSEEARYCLSLDAGRTWGEPRTLAAAPEPGLAVSHGVFWSVGGRLWAYHGAYRGTLSGVHTRAFVLDEASGRWEPRGTVIGGGFWPMQPPLALPDGSYLMAGVCVGGANPPAVALSRGGDPLAWDLVVLEPPAGQQTWGESTVFLEGRRLFNVARFGALPLALLATSDDLGRSWTAARPSNLAMVTSKPFAGTLSSGEHYLIATTTADGGTRRSPLTIALSRPGQTAFSRVLRIRGAVFADGPGESNAAAALSYPYAVEHDGHLYVGYSNNGGNVGRVGAGRELWNNNSAELAVIPLSSLRSQP